MFAMRKGKHCKTHLCKRCNPYPHLLHLSSTDLDHRTPPLPEMTSPLSAPSKVFAFSSSTIVEHKEGVEATSSSLVGQDDLLIVGPGVLGRTVAKQWRKDIIFYLFEDGFLNHRIQGGHIGDGNGCNQTFAIYDR